MNYGCSKIYVDKNYVGKNYVVDQALCGQEWCWTRILLLKHRAKNWHHVATETLCRIYYDLKQFLSYFKELCWQQTGWKLAPCHHRQLM